MPTLSGTILTAGLAAVPESTTLRFTRNQGVESGGAGVWSGGRLETTTDVNGRFGPVTMASGYWLLEWLTGYHQNRVTFQIPDGNLAWELGYLLTPQGFGYKFVGQMILILNVDTGEYHPIDIDEDGLFRIWNPTTVLTYPNWDIEPTTNTFRILNSGGDGYPLTWDGLTSEDGLLVIGDANGTVTDGNYLLNRWLEIRNPDEATLPYRQFFLVGARDTPTWALGSATAGGEGSSGTIIAAGTDPIFDSITMRRGTDLYRLTAVSETEDGHPVLQWVKIT